MKKLFICIFICLVMFIIGGCNKEYENDTIQNDLLTYVSEVSPIFKEEETILKDYRSVAGENYNKNDTYVVIKRIVIPKYIELIKKFEKVVPKTTEVKKIHNIYTKAIYIRLDAFKDIKQGFEKEDSNIIKNTDEKLKKAQNMIDDYKKTIKTLGEKHNTKINIIKVE